MKKLFLLIAAASIVRAQSLDNVMTTQPEWKQLAAEQQFPEGPAWDGQTALYSSSCYGKWINNIVEGTSSVFLSAQSEPFTLNQTNGLTVGKDGNIYACDYGIGAILQISPGGKTEMYASGYMKKKFNRPNDLAFDQNGNLYFTDPKSYNRDTLDGRVFMVKHDTKEVVRVEENLGFPNGITFSKDFKYVFVCESAKQCILKYERDEKGKLIKQKTFVELPGGDPDGIAFDEKGNLYAAHFGGGAVYVIDPDGKILYRMKTPGKKPSNIEFGGSDMKTLFLTEDETNSVYQTRMRVAGLPLNR